MVLAALCRGVVDYAGMFPPAKLALIDAMECYARYRRGDDAWMLNRFVIAAHDLEGFAREASHHVPGGETWPLSVVCRSLDDIEHACGWRSDVAVVESVETKVAPTGGLGCELFIELPLPAGSKELRAIKDRSAMLKIRLGGDKPDSIPTSSRLAQVLSTCAELDLPWKATAGLHHALRSETHGFLNLLLGAAFAHADGSVAELEALLDETNPRAFDFENGSASWREHHFGLDQIATTRAFFLSFGSCSFEEPTESLKGLGLR